MISYRLTSAETDADVALEADIIAGRKFESVKSGDERSSFRVLRPGAKDGRICWATVFVRDQVSIVVVRHGIAAACKSAVNT